MYTLLGRFWLAVALPVLLAGCLDLKLGQDTVLGHRFNPKVMHRFYDPMIESAATHEMSVADIHFVPHTNALNELGTRRLDQLAGILKQYGGVVRYETNSKDDERIAARLETITGYLTDGGLDMANVTVTSMMSGGRGMSARDAAVAKEHAAVAAESAASGQSSPTATTP